MHTHVDDFLIAFMKASKAHRERCTEVSCAHALFETTDWHGRVLWSDISKDGSHMKSDTGKVDAGFRVCEH